MTWNEAEAAFPDGSVAVHVTVVRPTAKVLPDAGRHEAVTGPELSVALAAKVTSAPLRPTAACAVISAGTVSSGSSLSSTTIPNDAGALMRPSAAALQVTSVLPIAYSGPGRSHDTTTPAPATVAA